VPRPTEATALAGGEDDGDGALAHSPSLPGRPRFVADGTARLSNE
jgi:hypothetical protein